MAEQQITLPDHDAIRTDLQYMTARWDELPEPAVFEIRAFKEGAQPQSAKFSPDWIDDAVDWAADMNELGFNIYAVRNPIRQDATGSARDSDILAAFFLWADCDDDDSAGNVKRFDGPKYSAAVVTGRKPSVRVHTYWQLAEPCFDMTLWREMQTSIAQHFGSDRAVVNPSRIMRVGGTVAYPAEKKRAKGYQKELTTIRTQYPDERPRVTMDQMRRVFGAAKPTNSASGIEIDTGAMPSLDRALAVANIKAGTDWRENVKSLVASYVARGWTDDEIMDRCAAFTLSGWTEEETRADVAAFITWTREQEARNGGRYATSPSSVQAGTTFNPALKPEGDVFKTWQVVNPLAIPRREFIYGRHYIRRFASVTVAPGGLGKSTLVLAECIAIATGRDILGVQPMSRQRVVYYNAEDPIEEIQRRIVALLTIHDIPQEELCGWLYLASGRDADLIFATGEQGDIVEPVFEFMETWAADIGPAVFVFDPLANMTESPETNDVFRKLGKRISRMADKLNCSVEIVHHTRKLNGKEAEIEDSRGGGALVGAVRAGRVLNPMTPDESVRAGLETHIDHFRIESAGKNNLARPSPHAEWFQRVSIELPNGDHVAAIKKWEWPDAFDGVTSDDARRVQIAVAEMEDDPPRENAQAHNWVGHVAGRVLGMDTEDKATKERVKLMIKAWVKSGVLLVEEAKDSRTGREVKIVLAGPNNPAANPERL